jgi:hypothetical protein
MLAMAEYAYNNSKHPSTKISPCYENYSFEPRTNWPTEIQFQNPASELYGHYMNDVHRKLKIRLQESVEWMKKDYTKRRKNVEPLKKGELVMLNGRNIRAKHRCNKVEDKMLGPFKVLGVGSNLRYCKLELPDSWKIHPSFKIDLLERYKGTDSKNKVIEMEADREDWVMETIRASGPSDDNPKHHVFLVQWKDFMQEENTCKSYEDVEEHNMELLEDHYEQNSGIDEDVRYSKRNECK